MDYASLYPLHDAVDMADIDAIKTLLSQGHQVDEKTDFDETPLLRATIKGNLDIVNILLDAKADPNIVNFTSLFPLAWAAGSGNFNITQRLLQAGANTNLQCGDMGYTPFMNAAKKGHASIVHLLLPFIPSDLKEISFTFAWWDAISGGHHQVITVLAPHIEPNVCNDEQQTALHLLCGHCITDTQSNRYFESLQTLLAHPKLKPNLKNTNGETPLDYAVIAFIQYRYQNDSQYSLVCSNFKQLVNVLILHNIELEKASVNYEETTQHPQSTTLYQRLMITESPSSEKQLKEYYSFIKETINHTNNAIQTTQSHYNLPNLKITKAWINLDFSFCKKRRLVQSNQIETNLNNASSMQEDKFNHLNQAILKTNLTPAQITLLDCVKGKGHFGKLPIEIRSIIIEYMANLLYQIIQKPSFEAVSTSNPACSPKQTF